MLRTGKTLLRLSSGTIRKLAFNFLSDLNIPVFRFAMGIVSIMIPEDMLQSVGVFLCTWCYLHMQVCPDLEVNHMRHSWENATCGLQLVQHYIYALDNQHWWLHKLRFLFFMLVRNTTFKFYEGVCLCVAVVALCVCGGGFRTVLRWWPTEHGRCAILHCFWCPVKTFTFIFWHHH